MNLTTNQTSTQEPISAQTATIISLSLVIVFVLLIIFICIYKSCNKRKQKRNNKIPEPFQHRQELSLLTPEQISRLPPDQQIKIQQYQQSIQQGSRIFGR